MEKKIDEQTFDFALEVVALYKYLIGNKEYILFKADVKIGNINWCERAGVTSSSKQS